MINKIDVTMTSGIVVDDKSAAASPCGVLNQDLWPIIIQHTIIANPDTHQRSHIPKHFDNFLAINKSIGWLTARQIATDDMMILKSGQEFSEYVTAIRRFQQPGLMEYMRYINLCFPGPEDAKVGLQALKDINLSKIELLEIDFSSMTKRYVTSKIIYRQPLQIPMRSVQWFASMWAPRNEQKAARVILAGKPLQPIRMIETSHHVDLIHWKSIGCWMEIEAQLRSVKAPRCIISGINDPIVTEEIVKQMAGNWEDCFGR